MSYELLYSLYWGGRLSTREIAKRLKKSQRTIMYHMEKLGIPRRSRSEACTLRSSKPEWKRKASKTWIKRGERFSQQTEFQRGIGCPDMFEAKRKRRASQVTRERNLENWKNPEYRRKMLRMLMTVNPPSKAELELKAFIEKHGLPFSYVGDGKVIIAGKCPDFINNNGGKQVIEFFGFWKHTKEEAEERKKLFRQYGFDTLILWYEDLKNETRLLSKINNLIGGIE